MSPEDAGLRPAPGRTCDVHGVRGPSAWTYEPRPECSAAAAGAVDRRWRAGRDTGVDRLQPGDDLTG